MKITSYSLNSSKFLTVLLIVALILAATPVSLAFAAVGVVTQWNSTAVIDAATATSPQTGTYTVAAGTNRLLVVTATLEYSAVTAHNVSATYGGQALTMITQNTAQRQTVWVGYLNEAGIAAASNTTLSVSFNTTNFTRLVVHAATYNSVDQSAPVVDSASASNNATNNLSFSNVAVTNGGYIFYASIRDNSGAATPPAGGGYTEHFDLTYGGPPAVFAKSTASKAVTATGTETQTVTFGGGNVGVALAVISLNPATAPTITSSAPTDGTVNNVYSHSYTATGSTPISYSVTAGMLPPGLTLSSAGVLSGTPTTAGTYNGTVTASNGIAPNSTQDFSITIDPADTVTAITSDTPDPSVFGQSVTVNFTVAGQFGNSPTAPTGNVTVSDGVDSCVGTVAAGSCSLTFSSVGAKSLTATYAGDSNFNGSSSSPATGHTVNQADTTTTITSDLPDPSAGGQSVTVQFNVSVSAPGAGTPTGNVTVSDGVDSCIGTVAAGQCDITLTTEGIRTLTASYAGDASFNGSVSAGASHLVDGTAPDTTITATPTDPSADSTPTFSFIGSDGGTGVASFECQIDSGGFSACNSGDSFGPLGDGSHTFEVRAIDNVGNVDATPASFTWTVDASAPDTTIDSSPADPDNDNTPAFTFSSTDGTATFECQIDGGGFSACNSGDVFGPLGDGSHTFEVRAVDGLGNTDPTPAAYTWTIDTSVPDTTIDSNPANPSSMADASFTFSSPDADVVGFECQLDGGGFAACTTPRTYLGLSGGSHTFEVRAVDASNNIDPTPASFTWTIDLGFPTVSSTTPANNATLTTGPTQLVVRFSEDVKSDGSTEAANNTVNYLLVENGANNTFNTLSCVGGLVADDTLIAVNSATYSNNGGSGPFVATLNINGGAALPAGTYRLFICGTTSIEDVASNELNNGTDSVLNFTVAPASGGGGGGTGGNNNNTNNQTATGGFLIPVTGFPKNVVSDLPAQPANMTYASTNIWLEIPSLGVKTSIVGVPKTQNGWDVTWLGNEAGWLNGTAFPTWNGNSVVTAHVWDALNKPGPFAKLKDLKYGDQIRVHAFGQVYIYEIRESTLIAPNNLSAMLKHEEKSWLTLITCEDYKESTNSYSSRRMLRAVLISVVADK